VVTLKSGDLLEKGVMYKVCSLDYINSEIFDVDILSADEKILYPAGTKITPEILLKLYFKEIYADEKTKIEQLDILPQEQVVEIENNTRTDEYNFDVDEKGYIIFDEQQAMRVSDLALSIGKEIKYNKEQLEILKQGAYYHNIGITNFKPEDLRKKDFKQLQAQAGYEILKNQKNMPEEIALCAKLWINNYEPSAHNLKEDIPYHHVVAISRFYDKLGTQKIQKEKILEIMLKCGGNKFNIYVLHKFIRMMRGQNG